MNKLFLSLSIQDKILFAKRLSILIKAGVPLLECLQMMHKQASTRSTRKILEVLKADVESGQYLSASMTKFKKIFGDFAVNIIRVGEVSGTLYENLHYLAEELKKKQALRRKVVNALVYPIFIIIATFGITGLLTIYVFPKVLPIFSSLNFPLPWTTKVLIFISNLFLHYGFWILGGLVGLVAVFFFLMRNKKFKLFFDRTILRIPLVGRISQGYNMANLCRTFGLLLKSDVMIVEAAKITANSLNNLAYRKELHAIGENITKGETVSAHMHRKSKLFPAILSQMVTVGESTGNLSDTLIYLSDLYESEVDDLTKNLSSVLEPALMAFMGIIVGFIAISIITPIYEVTQYLKP
ncbi:MAG: type II secretion system F family protein [Candidatus Doudnabacteria bacterium]|nr:type II secretion system F family protein [Candidatus Doudnabacteria bacterium]